MPSIGHSSRTMQVNGFTKGQADERFLMPRRNLLINGGFDVWQRGDTFNATGTGYTADRWECNTGDPGITLSKGTFSPGQVEVEGNPTSYIQCSKAGISSAWQIRQKIENVQIMSDALLVYTFWMKTGATPPVINVFQNFGSAGSAQVQAVTESTPQVSIQNELWTKYEAHIEIPSIAGKTVDGGSYTLIQVVESAATATDNGFTRAQLEFGDVATSFERRHIGEELALCQRYYQAIKRGRASYGWQLDANTSHLFVACPCPVAFRVPPVVSASSWGTRYCSTDDSASEIFERPVSGATVRGHSTPDGGYILSAILMRDANASFTRNGYAEVEAGLDAEL